MSDSSVLAMSIPHLPPLGQTWAGWEVCVSISFLRPQARSCRTKSLSLSSLAATCLNCRPLREARCWHWVTMVISPNSVNVWLLFFLSFTKMTCCMYRIWFFHIVSCSCSSFIYSLMYYIVRLFYNLLSYFLLIGYLCCFSFLLLWTVRLWTQHLFH